jgi:glycosyltransferase involved in cell wall biosynthesis
VPGRDPDAFAAYTSEILDNGLLAAQMATHAAVRAKQYTWSLAAARLRRVYADVSARALVQCT